MQRQRAAVDPTTRRPWSVRIGVVTGILICVFGVGLRRAVAVPTGTPGRSSAAALNPVACYGSLAGDKLNRPIVGIARTTDSAGYWLVGSDGGIFTFGDAVFYGSTGAVHLNKPIVGMASTPDGRGYWLVASDGGVFTFGDAVFYGSAGAVHLNKPIVGMAATPSGRGYWLAAADAGVFTYGDAAYLGGGPLVQDGNAVNDFSAFAASTDGTGYLMADSGRAFLLNFGSAKYFGLGYTAADTSSLAGLTSPLSAAGNGYWEATQLGSVYALSAGGQATC